MKNIDSKIEQNPPRKNNVERPEEKEMELKMGDFYKRHFEEAGEARVKIVSLEALKELKEKGITAEKFLDYLCQNHGVLLHGSICEISGDKLKSRWNKVFASNKSAIAIMRSLYSNVNVNLEYPYFINEESPLVLQVHTPADKKFIKTEKGFIYIVDGAGFKNEPEGSWQFIKETGGVEFGAVVETENDDFKYLVEFYDDLDSEEE